ncbi:MAG: DUF5662 family protein [Lachnospiraceae bacterium]|nr:DUF5662 family protein [Agathobacter sp.]MDD6445848.1 DUF5662 family protein [Lachnospiraceae bacterium]MDY4893257.1 DUF5662 family protein [Agathobacter sp.]
MGNAWKHFCTITHHKNLVMAGCFKIGLYKQGLLHDLSKYSSTEFLVGCKYYQGNMSPNNAERKDKGYSLAWLHHKGRNKHHLEYWIDYGVSNENGKEHRGMVGMKMPVRYVCEMFIDRISASKNYQKEQYTDHSALDYFLKGKDHYLIHPDTEALLWYLLLMLAKRGEKDTFAFVKNEVLKGKVPYEKAELEKRMKELVP